mgnify:CR=1 FL=1
MCLLQMRLCLVGDRCGKTSLLQRWMHPHRPIEPESTVAIDLKSFSISIDKRRVIVRAWDCSGSNAYDSLLDKYIFNSSVTLICFDLTRMDSWIKAQYWIKRCQEKPFCLIGTKLDRESEREVKEYTIKQYLKEVGFALYHEVSAYTGENCTDCLQMIVRESIRNVDVFTVNDFQDKSTCFVM